MESAGEGKREEALRCPSLGGAPLAVPAPPQSPRGAERSRRGWGITEPGGADGMGVVGKGGKRKGEKG